MTNDGFRVTEEIAGAHARLENYPLLPGDLLVIDGPLFAGGPNSYTKEAPGICVLGFVLTPEQEALLEPVKFLFNGLDYQIIKS